MQNSGIQRTCKKCLKSQAIENFKFYNEPKGWRRWECADCMRKAMTRFARERKTRRSPVEVEEQKAKHFAWQNTLKGKERNLNAQLLYRFGINLATFREMEAQQGGVCAICKTKPPTSNNRRLSIDHDHVSGAIRALLCDNCNRGLGMFMERPKLLHAAIAYLDTFKRAERLGVAC